MVIGNLICGHMRNCPKCGSVYLVPPEPSDDSGNAEPISAAITLDHFAGIPHHRFRFQCSTCTFMMDVLMHSPHTTVAHTRVVYSTSPEYDESIAAGMADIGTHPVHAPVHQACLAAPTFSPTQFRDFLRKNSLFRPRADSLKFVHFLSKPLMVT
jgi:hypothetical protein